MTPARMRRWRLDDRGFALLIVLWSLVPLSLLFLMLAATARSDAQSAADLRTAAALEAAADGAINTAIFDAVAGGVLNVPPRSIRMPGAVVAVGLVRLSGLVNPNTAPPQLLRALLGRVGADDASARRVAAGMVDWRTQGQKVSPYGAKRGEYQAAGRDYGPPGTPFESLDELGLVLGMTPALLRALTPYLSLYAYGDPDPQVAALPVRLALRDVGMVRGAGALRTQVVEITASAAGSGDGRAIRRAVVAVGPSANGRAWRVLSWDTLFDR